VGGETLFIGWRGRGEEPGLNFDIETYMRNWEVDIGGTVK